MNFIFEPWHWFVLGVLLMILELILPMFAALWFGLAAMVVTASASNPAVDWPCA